MKKTLLFILISTLCFGQKWSISFAERSSLVNFYQATNGDHWNIKWDFEKDPKYWYGIKINKGSVIEINLRGNGLKGDFPNTISGFDKLERLDLSSNQLGGELSNSVAGLRHLSQLDLSNNRFTADPSFSLESLSTLQELSLGNNNFSFGDIDGFLQNFPDLKVLDLAYAGILAVPQKISTLTKLETLDLSNNLISKNFSNLSTLLILKELNLSGNQLTKVPTELTTLTQLKILNLSRNAISQNFTTALSSLKNLEWLSFQDNNMTGFPPELPQLKKLIHLNFSHNRISSGFETLISLQNLEQIYFDKNLISGVFPSSFLQLKKLQMLSLNGNQLSGDIPKNIPPLTFLDNNRFTKNNIKTFLLKEKALVDFTYSPQRYDEQKTIVASLGSYTKLPQSIDGSDFQFTWFKNLDHNTSLHTEQYSINDVKEDDFTDYTCEAYYFEVLHADLMEVSFFREPVTLSKGLGTNEVKSDLVVYPNPAKDLINIKTTQLKIEEVYIFDLSGKLILTTKNKNIKINDLPSAIYIISIKTDEGIRSVKFIKE